MYFIGTDIGGTKTAVLLTDQKLNKIAEHVYPTPHGDVLAEQLIATIRQLLADEEIQQEAVRAIGVGIPGMVDPIQGTVTMAINLQIKRPLPLVRLLQEAFSTYASIENDARIAAYGVHKRYQTDHIAYLNLGTGVSAGVVLNGRIHRGVNGMAGEIGHLPLLSTQDILENSISGKALIRNGRAANLPISSPTQLFTLAQQNHPKAQTIIQEFTHHLTQTILWLIMSYDVHQLVIGGGLTNAGDAFFSPLLASIKQTITHSHVANQLVPNTQISLLPSHYNPGLWGAIHLANEAAKAHA